MIERPLLALDLDGTLWDHLDISSTSPPFRRVGPYTIVDSRGVAINLYTDMARLVTMARSMEFIVASLSWNTPWKALEALRAFGVIGLFDYHVIEPHPGKGKSLKRLIKWLERCRRIVIRPECIVYIDDRTIHLDEVRALVGPVRFLDAGECRLGGECLELLRHLASVCSKK